MAIIKNVEKQAQASIVEPLVSCYLMDQLFFNVAIRTLQMQGNNAIYGVGGGITWDSKWEAEYEETRQKSAILYRQNPRFDLISTGRIHQGKLLHLKEHLNRLQESSRYFAYPFNKEVQNQVEDLCQSLILTQTTVLNCPLQKMVNLLLNMLN